jgi:hypothetical protein
MMSLGGIRLNGRTDDIEREGCVAKVNHGVHSVLDGSWMVLGWFLEVFLDLSPTTKHAGGIFNFYGTIVFGYDYTKKNGVFFVFLVLS